MHRPLTWFAGIGGAVLMLLSACSGGSDRTPSEPSTIKIGVIIPTRGQSASLAASFEKAVRVSVDTLPATTKHSYQLVVADAGDGTEEDNKRAARQLVDEHEVAAIVGGISKVGEHVAPIATAANVPHICICSIPTIGDGRYNYTNIPLAEDEAEAWVAEAKARGLRDRHPGPEVRQRRRPRQRPEGCRQRRRHAGRLRVPLPGRHHGLPQAHDGGRRDETRRLFRLRLRAVADRPRQADPGGREGARQGPQRGVHRRDRSPRTCGSSRAPGTPTATCPGPRCSNSS